MAKRARHKELDRPSQGGLPVRSGRDMQSGPPAWAMLLVLGFLIAAVFGPSINVSWVFDDRDSILGNQSIVSLWPLIGSTKPGPLNPPPEIPVSGRPLVNLSFAINYYLGGQN